MAISKVKYDRIRYMPTLVGALAPLAMLMSIPPLTGPWKSSGEDRITETQEVKDPVTTGLIAAGLIFELMAACFLMARFMEKRVVLTTWLAIGSYTAHASFMLGPLVSFLVLTPPLPPPSTEKLTGDYLAGLATSGISILSAILLMLDYFRNDRLRKQGSGVTSNQRQLVFLTILVTVWSTLGALIFSRVEKWSFTKGIYFTLVTMTTIGFGDLVPAQTGTRIFLFPYAITGVVMMGLLINAIRIVILDSFQQVYFEHVVDQLPSTFLSSLYFDQGDESSKSNLLENNKKEGEEQGLLDPIEASEVRKHRRKLIDEKRGGHLIRQLQFSILALLLFWFLGALIFMPLENWSYFNALYFCFVSFTTIGYGDVTPKTFPGIVAFIGYSLIGLVAAAYVISVGSELVTTSLDRRADQISNKQERKRIEADNSSDIDLNPMFELPSELDNNENELLIEACHEYYSKVAMLLADKDGNFSNSLISHPELNQLDRYHKAFGQFLTKLGHAPSKISLKHQEELTLSRSATLAPPQDQFQDIEMS